MPPAPRAASTEAPAPHLSRLAFAFALLVTLGIFFLLHPLWRPMDMSAMDRNIIWSYAAIPPLVAGLLRLERKWSWSTWLLETIRLTFVKFAITFLFANVLWTLVSTPGPELPADATPVAAPVEAPGAAAGTATDAAPPAGTDAPPDAAAASDRGASSDTAAEGLPDPAAMTSDTEGRFEVRPPPEPSVLDPERTGRITGIVVDAAGRPRAGALVAVTGGLGELVFATRPDRLELVHDGRSLSPPHAMLVLWETLVLRSQADVLHSVRAFDEDGRQLFNLPLYPGEEHQLMFDRPLGRVRLGCAVHEREEPEVELAVVQGPFATWTRNDGRFAFPELPAGRLELTVWGPAGRVANKVSALVGGTTDVRLTVP